MMGAGNRTSEWIDVSRGRRALLILISGPQDALRSGTWPESNHCKLTVFYRIFRGLPFHLLTILLTHFSLCDVALCRAMGEHTAAS